MQQENELYVVYKHTNTINGKMYVGQTCQELKDRWKDGGKGYKKFWVDKNGIKHPSHFWSAIQKYGWNNFEHKVLIHGLTKSQADFWEKKLIKEWDLINPQKGYNKREGGSGGKLSNESKQKVSDSKKYKYIIGETKPWNKGLKGCFTDEILEKMRVATKSRLKNKENHPMYGKHHTEETKQKISKTKIGMYAGENNPMYGKHHTQETKNKIINSLKGKISGIKHPNATKVVRLSDNKIYNLVEDCAKDNNLSRVTVSTHCLNHLKTKPQEFMYYTDWIKQQKDES